MRIGYGYDVHRLVPGRKLTLCGVVIPHETGLLGHSDADVATHALMDALLGALALGDIGFFFPDTDVAFKGADSIRLLTLLLERPEFSGWKVGNCDITILAERPKLMPYRDAMRQCLAGALAVSLDRVSVKATTTEKLGFTGREEGIAAAAVVLLEYHP